MCVKKLIAMRSEFRIIIFIVCVLYIFVGAIVHTQVNNNQNQPWPPAWTEKCIGCICEAASACNLTIGCLGDYCGMFLISRLYWEDADSPILPGDDRSSPEAFQRCVLDSYCASRTVNQYINKFIKDCNGDGNLTCDDYVRLHYYGHQQCSKAIDSMPYYLVFNKCFLQN